MGFIITLVGIIWFFISLPKADKPPPSKISNYIEKIEQFALQIFNQKHKQSNFIEAETYYSFKQAPALLKKPKVTTFDEQGKERHLLVAKRANYFSNGEIKLKGKVNIKAKSGANYQIDTEEISVDTKANSLKSSKKIIYNDGKSKIIAQGMNMDYASNKMNLTGKIKIMQKGGQQILTRDLLVDQQKDNVIYQTPEKVHYQSKAANIHAKGMHYDSKAQKIKLTGGVIGLYE